MTRLLSLTVAVALVSLAGCDGGKPNTDPNALPASGTYFDKCKVVCEQEATGTGACTGYTVDTCTRQCSALAEGLPIACAQCRITGGYVSDNGSECGGFHLSTSCSECDGVEAPAPTGDVYLNRCKVVCAREGLPYGSCQDYTAQTCVEDCAALAAGLPLACGQCQVESGYVSSTDSACEGFHLSTSCGSRCTSPKPDAPEVKVYEDKCRVVCAQEGLPYGACTSYTEDTCVKECTALAAGLPMLCGQCRVVQGYVSSTVDRCKGFALSSACASACEPPPAPAAPPDSLYQSKCEVVCTHERYGDCATFPQATCVQQCTTLASGLPLLCGQCKVENGYLSGDPGTCTGFELSSSCTSLCK